MAWPFHGLAHRVLRRSGMPSGGGRGRRHLFGSDSGRFPSDPVVAHAMATGSAGGFRCWNLVEAVWFQRKVIQTQASSELPSPDFFLPKLLIEVAAKRLRILLIRVSRFGLKFTTW